MMVKHKGIAFNLGGDDYIIPPISLGALEQLQDRIASFTGNANDKEQISTVVDAAFSALRRNYPEITREAVAEMIDLGNMIEVFGAVMDVSGLKRKEIEEGEGPGNP